MQLEIAAWMQLTSAALSTLLLCASTTYPAEGPFQTPDIHPYEPQACGFPTEHWFALYKARFTKTGPRVEKQASAGLLLWTQALCAAVKSSLHACCVSMQTVTSAITVSDKHRSSIRSTPAVSNLWKLKSSAAISGHPRDENTLSWSWPKVQLSSEWSTHPCRHFHCLWKQQLQPVLAALL